MRQPRVLVKQVAPQKRLQAAAMDRAVLHALERLCVSGMLAQIGRNLLHALLAQQFIVLAGRQHPPKGRARLGGDCVFTVLHRRHLPMQRPTI